LASLSSSIAFNSIFNMFGKLSVRVISFLFALLIIRFLGDEDYGQYTLIWSYLTIFAMFSDAGLGMYLTREVAKNKSSAQYLISNIITIRLMLASATTVIVLVVTWLLDYPEKFVLRVLFASLVLWLYAIQDPLDALLQGLERFDLATTAVTIGQVVFVAVGVVVLWLGEGIEGLIVATLVNVSVSAVLAWLLITNHFENLQWNIRPRLWPKFLQASFHFGLIKVYLSWFLRIDMIILAWFWPDKVVGWYGAAYAIILGIGVISNAFSTAVYPTLSKQYIQNPATLSTVYRQILKYLLVFTLPAAGLISLTANNLIILLFGVEFAPAANILSILIWVVPLTFFSEFLKYTLLVANKEKETSRILLIGILFSITLNLGLTPTYGPVAAAVIAILAEAILVLLYLRQLSDHLTINNLGQVAFKPLVATGILVITLLVSKPLALIIQYIFGVSSYLLIIWLLKIVQSDECEPVVNLVLRQVGKISNRY
jgi:O-antigen/teichoic acid export membrane protein